MTFRAGSSAKTMDGHFLQDSMQHGQDFCLQTELCSISHGQRCPDDWLLVI